MNQETTAKMDHRNHRLSEKDHFRTATDFQNEICATYDLNICARAVRRHLRDFDSEKDHFEIVTDFQNEICATNDLNICARVVRWHLRDFDSEKDHFGTVTDFQNETCATNDLNICARAVRKYLRDFGPEGRVFRKNSIFSRKNQKLGIAFAKTHKHRTFQDLGKVFLLMKQNLVECNNEQLWIIVYLLFIISIIYQENSCLKIVSTAVCKKNISFLCFIEINRLCNYLKSLIL